MGTKDARQTSAGAAAAADAVDRLGPLGATSTSMFGGHGLFVEGVMFAMVTSAGDLAFRADDTTRGRYEAAGSQQKGKMPYWHVPPAVAEDEAQFQAWARDALAVARAATR